MWRRSMSSSAHQSTAGPPKLAQLPNLAQIYPIFFANTMKWCPKIVIPCVTNTKLTLTRCLSFVSITPN